MREVVPRSVRYRQVVSLQEKGLTSKQIAVALGISYGYVRDLVYDPDRSKTIARRTRYQGVCEDCGGPTDGSGGYAKAPTVCIYCANKRREPSHGDHTRYASVKWRCRCEACTAANTLYMYELRHRSGRTPPEHGLNGYQNYRCKCDVCVEASRKYNRSDAMREMHSAGTANGNVPLPPLSENQFQRQIVEIAQRLGYLAAHFPTSNPEGRYRTPLAYDAKGYCDLTLVQRGSGRVIFIEVKAQKGVLRVEQADWIGVLLQGENEVYIIRPSDTETIQRVLVHASAYEAMEQLTRATAQEVERCLNRTRVRVPQKHKKPKSPIDP